VSSMNFESPIVESKLPNELRGKFHDLFYEAFDLFSVNQDAESVEAAAVILHQHFKEEVTTNPVLASTISHDCLKWSLLEVLCVKTHWACRETIKFLIETNPHALLWARPSPGGFIKTAPFHMLPEKGHGALFPWIVERFPWVFQHELCQENPPHLVLVKCFGGKRCDLETVRKFYELYPQGLREKDRRDPESKYPLSLIVEGDAEPDADFVIWMAKQCPEAVYHEYIPGFTVLHRICSEMAEKENEFEHVPFKATYAQHGKNMPILH
jgi:hypothetical protein